MRHALLLALLLTTACVDAPAPWHPEPLHFADAAHPPLRVQAATIRVVEAPRRATANHVEERFPTPPARALRQWASERLAAQPGGHGTLEVSIDDASVIEVPLAKTQGVKGLFTDDQDARYDAKLHVTFRYYSGASALADATGDVEIQLSRSIHERATVVEREQLFDAMTRDLLQRFDQEANTRLHQYFSNWLQ